MEALTAFLQALRLEKDNRVLNIEVRKLDAVLSPEDQYAARAAVVDPNAAGPHAEGVVHEADPDFGFDLTDPVSRVRRPSFFSERARELK